MLKRPRGWRGRILVALLVMFLPGLILVRFWPKVAEHLAASAHLKSLGVQVEWSLDGSNWMQGGSTKIIPSNYWVSSRLVDGDLAEFKKLHRLESLALSGGTRITPDGLIALEGLTDLKELSFCMHHGTDNCGGVHTTDAGLVHLRGLSRLEELSLAGSPITDEGLSELAVLTNLKSLDLDATSITDAGLHHLLALKKLEALTLRDTSIGDEGMATLAKLPRLRQLNIEKTKVTPKGVFEVIRVIPGADIYHDHLMEKFETPEFVNSQQP